MVDRARAARARVTRAARAARQEAVARAATNVLDAEEARRAAQSEARMTAADVLEEEERATYAVDARKWSNIAEELLFLARMHAGSDDSD